MDIFNFLYLFKLSNIKKVNIFFKFVNIFQINEHFLNHKHYLNFMNIFKNLLSFLKKIIKNMIFFKLTIVFEFVNIF